MPYYKDFPDEILSEEAVRNLFERFHEGDNHAKEKLILHSMRLVIHIANKFQNTSYDVEDFISMGTIGLIKAISTFKLDKNIRFVTYASRCIENEILMFLRTNRKRENDISLLTPINEEANGNIMTFEQVLKDEKPIAEETVIQRIECEAIRESLAELSDIEQEVIKLRFGFYDNIIYKQEEIANMFGYSQSYISRVIKGACPKIRQKYLQKI